MRKIFTLLIVTIIFISCNPCGKIGPIFWGGYLMHRAASLENEMTLEPAKVALRLGMLLKDAQLQGKTDLSQVVLEVDGAPDLSLMEYLFGKGDFKTQLELIDKESGKWEITYHPSGDVLNNKFAMSGTLYITTRNKNFDEPGATWKIEFKEDTQEDDFFGFDTYNSVNSKKKYTVESYTIDCISTGKWDVSVKDMKCDNQSYWQSDWSLDFTVECPAYQSTASLFAQVETKGVTLYGASEGLAMTHSGFAHKYQVDKAKPLVFSRLKSSCANPYSRYVITSGMENVLIERHYTQTKCSPNEYPSSEVKVEWTGLVDCKAKATILYNGHEQEYEYEY